ncbi:MAG: hypothetical protein WCK59_03530 [Candidatus Falkowbacteria bacterium]
MDIVINTTRLDQFFNAAPADMAWQFFVNVGWMFIAVVFLLGVREIYLMYIEGKFAATLRNVILAIDIPKGNEQSPKAVENLFTYLGGAHGSISFWETWFEGKFQQSFSFEIISLEGYTQFLIRTPAESQSLIESAVYSQYPDAEISEIDDYTIGMPTKFPDEEWDIWGAEFVQGSPEAYPIKLYQEFEHKFGESETQFKDPMASLMDLCSSLRQGEQLWIQFIVIPIGFDWVKASDKEVDKILGKIAKTESAATKFMTWLGDLSEHVFAIWKDIKPKEVKTLSMMELTPKKKKQIEAIQMKSAKLGFGFKMRAVYMAKKEVLNRAKVVSGLVGWVKQFAALDLNNLKPDMNVTATKTAYFNKDKRLIVKKNKMIENYINRSGAGRSPGVLNIEELATLWHFPIDANVKAPFIQKAPGRKSDAPSTLPIFEENSSQSLPPDIFGDSSFRDRKVKTESEAPDSNNNDDLFWVEGSDLKDNSQKPNKKEDAGNNVPPFGLPFV